MRYLLASIVGILLAAPVPADAQWRAERPYRGLFASGVDNSEHLLTATASLGAGWDDNLVADALGRNTIPTAGLAESDVTRPFRGGLGTGSAALSYSFSRTAVAFGATAGTTARYYPSIESRFIRREYLSTGASAVVGGGLSVRASAAYQPYSLRGLYPELFDLRLADPAVVDEDFPSSVEHFVGYTGGATFERQISRRNTFSAGYDYHAREAAGGLGHFSNHTAGAGVDHVIGRGLTLRLGYRYSEALYGHGGRHAANHLIDAGVNYNRSLSFSRATTLSFGTGTTAVRSSRNEALRYHAIGNARVNHEIGRTWHATASYNRNLQFVETWPEPLFTDSATAGVGGLLNRRVQLQLTARALRGRGVFRTTDDRIESYGAAAGLTVAVNRHVNTGVTYAYYIHQFPGTTLLAPGFAHDFERRSIRAYVSVWAPLLQRARR